MERQAVADRGFAIDDYGLPAFDNGQHAVLVDPGIKTFASGRTVPVSMLGLGEHVSGIRKCRHPAAVDQPRVPAAMIGMEMGAANIVDRFRRYTGLRQPLEKRQVQLMEAWQRRSVLVIAGTAIDQDRTMSGFQHPGMDA
jgi:hypothetical protein